mmetsp:Transcript_14882/g.31959  ORF Transcript_14882/g.31959 Transcript_14882/m.31959 type:complete len:202 (+) Transcript_14882:140-745(+)
MPEQFVRPYGGRRRVGQNTRGGYFRSSNPWTFRFLPGVAIGYLMKIWFDQNKQTGKSGRKPAAPNKATPSTTPSKKKAPPFPADTKLKMVLVVRSDLGMGTGKIAAQCSHATVGTYKSILNGNKPLLSMWEKQGQPKIVLKCKDIVELNQISEEAGRRDLKTYMVSDAGHTQVTAGSVTVLAVGPGPVDVVDSVTGRLKLL